MGVNATFNGTLEIAGDRVRITLEQDQAIQINLDGIGTNPLLDPLVRLYDSNGDLLAENDDAFGSFDSELVFQANQAGSYYIEAAGYENLFSFYDGDYRITTTVVTGPIDPVEPIDPVPSTNALLNTIAWGTQLETSTVNVYFAPSGETFGGYTSEGFNAYERGQILEIMNTLSDMIDLDFTVVNNANQADLTLVLDLNELDPYLGTFNPPGEYNAGSGAFNGDLWDRSAGGDLERGGYGYVTLVHELLHGLGMAHPHDNGGTSTIMTGVSLEFDDYGSFNLNQGIFTVMTYNSGYFTGTAGSAPLNPEAGDFGFEGSAMALDIAYLQEIYGANTNHAGGNSVYTLARSNQSGTYWESIWDTGGADKIRHIGSDDATIDLRAATLRYENGGGGFVSSVDGIAGGFTIANGVVIENATGGSGNDDITGNAAANVLKGRGGNDVIDGGNGADNITGNRGADILTGGRGTDRIHGGNGTDRINGNGGADNLNGGGGADRINGGNGGDRLSGALGTDTLNGGGGRDTLKGGGQNDVLNGGGGADVLTGGGGSDRFVFTSLSHSRNNNVDTITDFSRGSDNINVSALDAVITRGGNQTFDFVGTSAFSDAGQIRITRDGGDVIVQADVNGDGAVDFEIIVENINTLSASDFIL